MRVVNKFGRLTIGLVAFFLFLGDAAKAQGYSESTLLRMEFQKNIAISREALLEESAVTIQTQNLANLLIYANEIDAYMTSQVDTHLVPALYEQYIEKYDLASEGIWVNPLPLLAARNLTISDILLVELAQSISLTLSNLNRVQQKLQGMQMRMDSMVNDNSIYYMPGDSVAFLRSRDLFIETQSRIKPTYTKLHNTTAEMVFWSNRLVELAKKVSMGRSYIKSKRLFIHEYAQKKGIENIWELAPRYRSANDAFSLGWGTAISALRYFLVNNTMRLSVLLILFLVIYGLVILARNNLKGDSENQLLLQNNVVFQFPALSTLFMTGIVGLFILLTPPFIFISIFYFLCASILIFWVRRFSIHPLARLHLLIVSLFLPIFLINTLLEPVPLEIYSIFAMALLGVFFSFYLLLKRSSFAGDRTFSIVLIFIFLISQSLAAVGITFGRYNFSKILLAAGYLSLITGVLFFYLQIISAQTLQLALVGFNNVKNQGLFFRVKKLQEVRPARIRMLFFIGVFIAFMRNLYFFTYILEVFKRELAHERMIGDYTFTIGSILLFVFIIVIAILLSRIIAFMLDDGAHAAAVERGKGGVRNWVLISRLAIIISGVMLAFAAAGIEMDRVAIILGSLGVGIGFGLQAIASNLVSGVMLAFERPVEIGDMVEVGGHVGTIREIGVRSSKLEDLNGSEVIIPNGNLYNSQLVNWTINHSQKRVSVNIAIEKANDLKKAQIIIREILFSHPKIKSIPAPDVLVDNITSSEVDFKLSFWVEISDAGKVKSEVIIGIVNSFRENGIELDTEEE